MNRGDGVERSPYGWEAPQMTTTFRASYVPEDAPRPWTGLTPSERRLLASARRVAHLSDEQFSVLGFRFGLDAIIGLIPVVGDLLATSFSLYLMWVGKRLGMSRARLVQMGAITVFDFVIGLVPFVGDAADAVLKSHMRNLGIIEAHVRRLEREHGRAG
jgi:hypothetical protein